MEGERWTPEDEEKGERSTLGHGMEGDGGGSRDAGNGMQGGDPRGWEGTGATTGDGMEGMRLRR